MTLIENYNMKPFARRTWRILIVLVIIMAGLQLFPRPLKNNSTAPQPARIQNGLPLSDTVNALLKTACYDCHSNRTHYPWYTNIQPLAWYMNNHIVDGKRN